MTTVRAARPPPPSGLHRQAPLLRPSAEGAHSLLGAHFISEQRRWSRSPAVIQNLCPSRVNVKMEWVLGNNREVLIF